MWTLGRSQGFWTSVYLSVRWPYSLNKLFLLILLAIKMWCWGGLGTNIVHLCSCLLMLQISWFLKWEEQQGYIPRSFFQDISIYSCAGLCAPPSPPSPPSRKKSGDWSRNSWPFSQKVVWINEIVRSVIIPSLQQVYIPFFEQVWCKVALSQNFSEAQEI